MHHHARPVEQFIATLRENGLERAWIVPDPVSGDLRASHPCIADVAAAIAVDGRDYRGHAGAFFEIGAHSGLLLSAFVHRTERGQAAGGVRFWRYQTFGELVADGLRLSRGMGQKCALAGLWWGGGKGVIARAADVDYNDESVRKRVFSDYGRFVSGLCGLYVTAEDVGTRPQDMAQVFVATRFTSCIPPQVGGSGNPGVLTAAGVVVAMEAALDMLGKDTLAGKHVALQGLGNVSSHMVALLLERGVGKITGADVNADAVAAIRGRWGDAPVTVRQVDASDASILAQDCDVLAPNAIGGSLNPRTIPTIRAPLVCGAANNQLEDPDRDADALRAAGKLYVPDFLANRMGIVNCANEQFGWFPGDPVIARHLARDWSVGIFQRCQEVIRRAQANGTSTHREAAAVADELQGEPHPLWPGRGAQIIDYLTGSDWADKGAA